jgi:hypothetical protein
MIMDTCTYIVYMYIHKCMHTYIHTYTIHTYIHIRVCLYAYVCTQLYKYLPIHGYWYMFVHSIHVHIHVHTCIHACTHTYMHSHTCVCMRTYVMQLYKYFPIHGYGYMYVYGMRSTSVCIHTYARTYVRTKYVRNTYYYVRATWDCERAVMLTWQQNIRQTKNINKLFICASRSPHLLRSRFFKRKKEKRKRKRNENAKLIFRTEKAQN